MDQNTQPTLPKDWHRELLDIPVVPDVPEMLVEDQAQAAGLWQSEQPSSVAAETQRTFTLPTAAARSTGTWGDRENEFLNYAIRRILQEHTSEIWAVAPELEPWRAKGRIHRHINKFLTSAPGGEAAKVRFEAEKAASNAKKRAVSTNASSGASGSGSGSASASSSKKPKVQ